MIESAVQFLWATASTAMRAMLQEKRYNVCVVRYDITFTFVYYKYTERERETLAS